MKNACELNVWFDWLLDSHRIVGAEIFPKTGHCVKKAHCLELRIIERHNAIR